ncbi:MAG: hypothetical protein FGM58_03165 [Acidimicrobiia bacterium]|nr:hypothetical protein [Acidimicrobiia bacterium]
METSSARLLHALGRLHDSGMPDRTSVHRIETSAHRGLPLPRYECGPQKRPLRSHHSMPGYRVVAVWRVKG